MCTKQGLNKLIPPIVRPFDNLTTHRERNQLLTVRPEPVEGLTSGPEAAIQGFPKQSRYPSGFTLIELVIFIVIVSVSLVGVLTVFNVTTKSSADPIIRKQALAIAEALLEEVMLQPFTYCDPDDATAATATSAVVAAGSCTSKVEGMGPDINPNTTTETRTSATDPFDNVNDYNGLSTTTNVAGGGAAKYTATVTVTAAALNTIASTDALLIKVSVSSGSETIDLEGYRTRHSPNSLP